MAIVGGIWAATVVDREIEGIVAIVTGCAAGIVSLVLRDTKGGASWFDDYRQYGKAIVALVAAVIVAIATALGNGEIGDLDGSDWVSIVLTILGGTALVWFVENIQGVAGGIIKAVIAALTAAVTALETGYFDGGISQGELLTAIGAFAATLALTYQIPNASPTGSGRPDRRGRRHHHAGPHHRRDAPDEAHQDRRNSHQLTLSWEQVPARSATGSSSTGRRPTPGTRPAPR